MLTSIKNFLLIFWPLPSAMTDERGIQNTIIVIVLVTTKAHAQYKAVNSLPTIYILWSPTPPSSSLWSAIKKLQKKEN